MNRSIQRRALLPAIMWAVGVFVPVHAIAGGSLEPDGSPGPTMYSLSEIYEKLLDIESAVESVAAAVPVTGQNETYGTGDDGELQRGVSAPSPRFEVGEGASSNCVVDKLSGLMWLKNPDSIQRDWTDALAYCAALDGEDGRGGFTDWRLPNIRELLSLVDYGRFFPALPVGHPFESEQFLNFWSGTTDHDMNDNAWYVDFYNGYSYFEPKTTTFKVWPVRSGN